MQTSTYKSRKLVTTPPPYKGYLSSDDFSLSGIAAIYWVFEVNVSFGPSLQDARSPSNATLRSGSELRLLESAASAFELRVSSPRA